METSWQNRSNWKCWCHSDRETLSEDVLLTVGIRADRPLSGAFSLSVSKYQGLLFHTILTSTKSFVLFYVNFSLIGLVPASLLAPPALIWSAFCPCCDTTWKALQETVQRDALAPTSAPFFDMHSLRSITSYITFRLGLEARFQLTGACDTALTVLTYIFPSSRDASPPLPLAVSESLH